MGRTADSPGWQVRVVPNKFPAFGPWPEGGRAGLFASRPAAGGQEVVVHSPRHVLSLAELSSRELELVAEAWRARAGAARGLGFPYVQALVNEGRGAGASLAHSHSQLVWLPEESPAVAGERRALEAAGGCLLCRLLAGELEQRVRVVAERNGLVLLCPFASRVPYELLVAPLACEADPFLPGSPLGGALALAADGISRLRALEGPLAFNLWLHAPGHWHVEVFPRRTVLAGLELGAGYYVNTLAPEEAARALREAQGS